MSRSLETTELSGPENYDPEGYLESCQNLGWSDFTKIVNGF